MSSHLGDCLKARRMALGFGRGEVARRMGYKNLSKGARRIETAEQDGVGPTGFIEAMVTLLGIDSAEVAALTEQDRADRLRAWAEWADQPVPAEVVVRCLPGVFGRHALPPGLTDPAEVVAYGQALAKRISKVVVVVLSRRLSVTIGADGRVVSRNVATPDCEVAPSMRAGRHRFVLPLSPSGAAEPNPYHQDRAGG